MKIIYAGENIPESFEKSLFLMGPSPRMKIVKSWRPKMLKYLQQIGYDGVVFVPERKSGKYEVKEQIEWEQNAINMSDLIVAWVPRQMNRMVGLTTNVEFGLYLNSGKLLYGRPTWSHRNTYLDYIYKQKLNENPISDLECLAKKAVEKVGNGAMRVGGERCIPLHIWNTNHFQNWYQQQKQVGNRLDDAKVLWNFVVSNKFPFCYSIWVKIWVEKEKRYKKNEFIVSRTDISSICAYYKKDNLLDTEILLVKEFRSPCRTEDGFIHELPGGSSFVAQNPCEVAANELEEETGIAISANRIKEVKSRQLAATFSTHKAFLFAVELNDMEIESAKMNVDMVHGNIQDSEMTYIEVKTVREILENNLVDWTTVGMIMEVLK
jgi:ADP-ribose pyrophosphatase YjhB (NUDIX family)